MNTVGQTAVVRRAQNGHIDLAGRLVGEFSAVGWKPDDEITEVQWGDCIGALDRVNQSSMWWLGDMLNYGEQWGDKHEQAIAKTGYSYGTLNDAKVVSKSFDFTRRRVNLSWSHHREVCGLPKPSQERWLNLAAEKGWSKGRFRSEIRRARGSETPAISGIYRVVYADPPWDYGNKGLDDYGHADRHYKSMTIDELCAMPVAQHVEENAVLFLWVTSPLLAECWPIIKAWGFEYRTSFVWDKVKHNHGHYNSVRHELLLICTRGACKPEVSKLHDSVVSIERGEHSEKPDWFAEMIEELYPSGNRIELFARKQREGWSVWGNEV